MYFFYNRVSSYFAKPNFVVYDEWFDNDFKKTKQKINEYKNTKKEVDKFIKGINLEYKSIKKEINDFF